MILMLCLRSAPPTLFVPEPLLLADYCSTLYEDDGSEVERCWLAYNWLDERLANTDAACEIEVRDGVVNGVDCQRLDKFQVCGATQLSVSNVRSIMVADRGHGLHTGLRPGDCRTRKCPKHGPHARGAGSSGEAETCEGRGRRGRCRPYRQGLAERYGVPLTASHSVMKWYGFRRQHPRRVHSGAGCCSDPRQPVAGRRRAQGAFGGAVPAVRRR